MKRISGLLCVLAIACGGSGAPAPKATLTAPPAGGDDADSRPDESPLADEAAAGVDDPELRALLRDDWERRMRRSPTYATKVGDHRFDDRLADRSWEAIQEQRAERRELLERARGIDASQLSADDRITLSLYVQALESKVTSEVCETPLWNISARSNAITRINYLAEMHSIDEPGDADDLLARYRKAPETIDDDIANLRRGLERGMVANAESVRRTIALVEGQLDTPIEDWALLRPAETGLDAWTEAEQRELAGRLRTVVADHIRPAYERYATFLRDEVLPEARAPEKAGLHGLQQGRDCYAAQIEHYIDLPKSAEELHALGLKELERINEEMTQLGAKLFDTDGLPATLKTLRNDPELYYDDGDEMLADARAALEAAREAIPEWFGILPEAECVVVPVPDYEAPYTTIAYYRKPHYDGSKPGEYFVNTYQPETRPRFEMEVLSYHEALPGHHLQIAIAQELGELPLLRKLGGSTAFIEGWGLYTERLSGEMGLYSGDLDRMGMLSYDAWRAARLVVDTGLHAMGWTRERAEQFMREHTALALNNIANEVDRYMANPGQALAYKVGQLEILRLRERARSELGDDFDIRGFHDVVLGNGAVTLPVLRGQVERWIESHQG